MARNVLVDAGLLVALISPKDRHHTWAIAQSKLWPSPWLTCESALSEAYFLVGAPGRPVLSALLRRGLVELRFDLSAEVDTVLALMDKYRDVPMSLADACLVRMTELLADPILLTTDSDFRAYRRHSRNVIPVAMP